MTEASPETPKRSAPWKGRRKVADPKSKPFPIRFTPEQFEQLNGTARDAGMSVGTFARTVLLGSPGPRAVRRPPVEKAELARILGELGRINFNVNQFAKAWNEWQGAPSLEEVKAIGADMRDIRTAIMQALGREP